MAFWKCPVVFLCLFMAYPLSARPPNILLNIPFFTVWNAPTERCSSRYGVDLDLSVFDIVQNRNQTFRGDNITIFYSNKLGFYPYYTPQKVPVYGGVPQNSSLEDHLIQAESDIRTTIPDQGFQGLAVVDWESWRPLWERNWDSKEVYCQGSKSLVKDKHPDWTRDQIEAQAKKDFETASQAFMEKTLKLGLAERPGGLWGFYGFPGCYNYLHKNSTYTGECPQPEIKCNNRLAWLWNVSTALYPSIYLPEELEGHSQDVLLYAQHRILEGMRVREQVTPVQPALIPYARIVFKDLNFLSEEDLVHTVGESVALGSSGVVLWGDETYSKNKTTCQEVKGYLDTTLGRYVVNVTEAASLCSRTLCSSQGRCLRKDPTSKAYLHLDPATWAILPTAKLSGQTTSGPSYVVKMRAMGSGERKSDFTELFKCQCFPGWEGKHCQKPVSREP